MHTEQKLTGYPSIDKPWLKYYTEDAKNGKLPECTIYEYMYQNNKEHLDDYAIDYFGTKITYGELFENIEKVAISFQELGVCSGEVVTIVSLSCVTSILCFYALNKIGAVSNYINVLSTEEELKDYLNDAQSRYVVSLDLFAGKILKVTEKTKVEKCIVYSLKEWMPAATKVGFSVKMRKFDTEFLSDNNVLLWKEFLQLSDNKNLKSYNKDPKTTGVLGHTGGTTGFPKTILIDDCGINAVAHQYYLTFERERGQKFLNIVIPFVIYGILTCMHMPLSLGLCLVVVPKFDDNEWSKYIKKYQPDFISAVPSFVLPMLKDIKMNKVDLSRLKLLAVGGDGMNEKSEIEMNKFLKDHNSNIEILKGYGMSEVCASAVTGMNGANKIGSIGIPLVKNNVKVIDENQAECKYGEVGELCLLCPALMIGYKGDETATNELIHINESGEKWVHTGDLAYVDEDGFVFLQGRIKRIILTTNDGMCYKVFPNIVETKIKSNDNVFEVCVIGAKDGENQVLRACIVKKQSVDISNEVLEKQLRDMFNKDMPEYQRPLYYEFVGSLPLTSVGKVDYKKLEEMYYGNNL